MVGLRHPTCQWHWHTILPSRSPYSSHLVPCQRHAPPHPIPYDGNTTPPRHSQTVKAAVAACPQKCRESESAAGDRDLPDLAANCQWDHWQGSNSLVTGFLMGALAGSCDSHGFPVVAVDADTVLEELKIALGRHNVTPCPPLASLRALVGAVAEEHNMVLHCCMSSESGPLSGGLYCPAPGTEREAFGAHRGHLKSTDLEEPEPEQLEVLTRAPYMVRASAITCVLIRRCVPG